MWLLVLIVQIALGEDSLGTLKECDLKLNSCTWVGLNSSIVSREEMLDTLVPPEKQEVRENVLEHALRLEGRMWFIYYWV